MSNQLIWATRNGGTQAPWASGRRVLAVAIALAGAGLLACFAGPTPEPQAPTSPGPPTVPNGVTIRGINGSGERPFTISRVFAQGHIPRFAQAQVEGVPTPTQCDVKTRWPDGSVQHALISFWADASRNLAVDFIDQESGNNDGALGPEGMLGYAYDFGAWMELDKAGTVLAADARAMLADGAFRYWLQGPICTQVIIEDRSEQLRYDLGWSDPKSFHPIFVATFYPGWRGVRVEMIGENSWTTKLQDLAYSLSLKVDRAPKLVYEKVGFLHDASTRWRKVFWSGPEPYEAVVDLNLAYMVASRALPAFDLTKSVPGGAVNAEVTTFERTDRGEPGGFAQWIRYMPTTGGRPDIGLFPRWYVRYLYTFNRDLHTVMLGNAAVSGHVPIHFRESVPGRFFDSQRSVDAFGRVVSVNARPTVSFVSGAASTAGDGIQPVAPLRATGWTVDLAHQASFAYVPYLVTGDWYFLEEIYFWAARNLATPDPTTVRWGRHGSWGYLPQQIQVRGQAWALRTLAHAAFMAPDESAEKTYFSEKLLNNIAVHEGRQNVPDGQFCQPDVAGQCSHPMWRWGRDTVAARTLNPLNFPDYGNSSASFDGLDRSRVAMPSTPFEYNYLLISLGHIDELGFPAKRLRDAVGKNLLHQLQNPSYNPFLIGTYRIPVIRRPDSQFFDSWAEVRAGYLDSAIKSWPGNSDRDHEHGYANIARAAASFLPGLIDNGLTGAEAWNWINTNVQFQDGFNGNPKWALLPRAQWETVMASRRKPANRTARNAADRRVVTPKKATAMVPLRKDHQ